MPSPSTRDSLRYGEFPPTAALRPHVEAFYVLRSTEPIARKASYRILPDGCIDLVVDLSADGGNRSVLIGAATRPGRVGLGQDVGFLGVRFSPGGLAGFMPVPAHELTDIRVELDLLWGPDAALLVERLQAERSWSHRVARLDAWLQERRTDHPLDPQIRDTVQLLRRQAGRVPLGRLEARTGISLRHLERKFRREVGVTPKEYARTVRLHAALAAMESADPPGLAAIAQASGYFDQAHFSREFKRLTGFTPTEWPGRHQGGGCPE
jgi:AraC-like DNA-binding protein